MDQTQSVASSAALSAETAKQSETAAKQAQTAAETAEDAARQYAAETEAGRQEVEKSKQSVEQMQNDVAKMQADVRADKEAVEQTVSEFGTAAQDALTAIGQAQNTAVSAVTEEGRKQATTVQETGAQAVSEVDTAKTAAVGAVTAEGDKQVGRVQEAAAEIVADREQIQHNKADITTLSDKTNTLAPGIVLGTKGGTITVSNASEQPLVGLTVYGKSTQASEPSVEHPQEIVSAGERGSITVEVTGRNLLKPNSYSTYYEFPLKANTVMTLMTNGKPSQGGNIKFIATDGSDVWFAIDKGQTRVCRSIENKDVKGFYNLLGMSAGLEYMFAVGNIKTYTPYVDPQSLTLATPNGLPGIPVATGGNYVDETGQQWITDEIDLSRGEKVQRVGNIIFDGSDDEKWSFIQDGLKSRAVIAIQNIDSGARCNSFRYCESLESESEPSGMFDLGSGRYFRFGIYGLCNSVEEWRTLLQTEPVEVLYILPDSIVTPLSPEEIASYKALHTYSPNTTIINDAGCEMSLTYTVDTKKYVDEKIAAISAAMIGG